MRENPVRRLWAEGKPALSAWCSIGNSLTAELLANQGFDAVCVDRQHGMIDFSDALHMFQAISTTPAAPFTRAPWNDPPSIMALLDAGAYGVICPMVNTADECRAFVGACRYPPQGFRSIGPTRAALYGGPDYMNEANSTIVTLAMVETRKALINVDAIARTPGLDGIFIGPADLALSLGERPSVEPVGAVAEAIDTILASAKAANIRCAIFTASGQMARRWFEKGFDLVALGGDVRFLTMAASAEVKLARGR